MTRKRRLRPEEEALWRKVVENATPLDKPRLSAGDDPETPGASLSKKKPVSVQTPRAALPPFEIGSKAGGRAGLAKTASTQLPGPAPRVDKKVFGRLRKGRLAPEGRIDLHGMTLAQAHPALNRFVLDAHAQNKRLVLVITGKGREGGDNWLAPAERGVLRRQVPQWLHSAPLGPVVLQVTPAHARHGGGGAYYVYLKRRR